MSVICSCDGIIVSSLEARNAFSWYDTILFSKVKILNCCCYLKYFMHHEFLCSSNTNDFICYSFLQEPFKSVPLIWIVHDSALGYRSRQYTATGQIELLNDWRRVFNRSSVVVFPNYALPVNSFFIAICFII
jgi:hypothetical protein